MLAGLGSILLVGNLALDWMAPGERSGSERMALGFALGCGVVALLLFYLSLVYAPLALGLTILFVLTLVSLAYGKRLFVKRQLALRCTKFSILATTPIFLLSGLAALVALKTDLGFDGWTDWGFKARVVYVEGGWTANYFAFPWPEFIHRDYPLLVASLEAWAFAWLGQADEHAIKIIFPFFYFCLLLLFYSAVRKIGSSRIAMLFSVLLGTVPYLASIAAPSGYADVPLMLYVLGAVVFVRRWFERGNDSDLLIGAMLAALGVWVKREGIVYWGINFVAIAIWLALARSKSARVRVRSLLIFLLPAVGIIVPWFAFLSTFHIQATDFALVLDFTRWVRLPFIAVNTIRQFLAVDMWGGLWIIFFVLSVARLRSSNFADGYVWVSAVIPFAVLQLSFLFSIWVPFTHHLELASERLCMHEIAIAWYWIALQSRGLDDWFSELIMRRVKRMGDNSCARGR